MYICTHVGLCFTVIKPISLQLTNNHFNYSNIFHLWVWEKNDNSRCVREPTEHYIRATSPVISYAVFNIVWRPFNNLVALPPTQDFGCLPPHSHLIRKWLWVPYQLLILFFTTPTRAVEFQLTASSFSVHCRYRYKEPRLLAWGITNCKNSSTNPCK